MENYKLENYLGQGSCGSVSLYTCCKTELKYAIKEIANRSQNRKIIEREKKILENLKNSPNIVSLKDSFAQGNNFYIVMEYCEGGSLEDYLHNRPSLPRRQKLAMIVDILRGLKSIHKKQIIHRDLKLSNCLVKDGIVKLADFGVSREYMRNIDLTACGTPLNLAPEVFKTNKYTSKIDIWSFGVVCYEILSGKHPFPANNYNELYQMIEKDPDYSGFSENEKSFLKLALNPISSYRSEVDGLLKSELISEYLSKIFNDLIILYLKVTEENSKLSQKVRLSICLYFLSEVLFTTDSSQFKSDLKALKLLLSISSFSSETREKLLKSLLKYTEQVNEKSAAYSSHLVYIHRRLSTVPNFEVFNLM